MPGDSRNQPLGRGIVMLPDDSGDLHPWSIIPRPGKKTEISNLAEAMELPHHPDESDSPQEEKEKKANKAMFRLIWNKVKLFFQQAMPPTVNGRPPQWSDITSAIRAMVHQQVSDAEPYMRRFEGGWATEEIMIRVLRNSRDTASRQEKDARVFKGRKPHPALDNKNGPGQSRLSGARAEVAKNAQQKSKLMARKKSRQSPPHTKQGPIDQIEAAGGESDEQDDSDSELLQLALQMLKENRSDLKARAKQVLNEDREMVFPSIDSNDDAFECDTTQAVAKNSKKRKSPGNPKQGIPQLAQLTKGKATGRAPSPEESWEDSVAAEIAELRATTNSSNPSKAGGTNGTTSSKKPRPKMRPPRSPSLETARSEPGSSGLTRQQKQELVENVEGTQSMSSDQVTTRKTCSRGRK